MIHRFIIEIETDAASGEDLRDAIAETIEFLDLPNGDNIYIDNPKVEIYVKNTIPPKIRAADDFMDGRNA